MFQYIIKRLLWLIPIMLGVSILIFSIMYFTTGDPVSYTHLFPAMIRLANRYADLAEEMAEEEPSGQRKAELLEMAKICRRVPEYPAQTFREGVQAFFFYWILIGSGTTPGGRFDQYLYPLYQACLLYTS